MENASIVAEALVSVIQQAPTPTVPGVQLATPIRHKFPTFKPTDHNCRNLRHFISRFAPRIQEVGRSGADIVYGLRPDQEGASAPQQPTMPTASFRPGRRFDPFVWKAFTNPTSAYRVQANAQTGELRSEPPSDTPVPPWVIIPPTNEDVHIQIARNFASGLHDPQKRAALEAVLEQPLWWTKFFPTALVLGLGVEWGAFRRRRLAEELEKALAALRIPKHAAVQRRDAVQPSPVSPPATADESLPKGDEQLRRIVLDVVRRLPSGDLRALRLPVGDVLDAINKGE
jgi:hypothetical protein